MPGGKIPVSSFTILTSCLLRRILDIISDIMWKCFCKYLPLFVGTFVYGSEIINTFIFTCLFLQRRGLKLKLI